jgi:hypothetical protein
MNVELLTAPAPAADAVVSKGKFAELLGVSAARVSQYLSEGKIKADALEGEGRNAKIRVELAKAQLRGELDIGQRFGNGIGTRLDPVLPLTPAPIDQPAAPMAALPAAPTPDPIEAALKRAKLEQAERANREAAMKEAAATGRYVPADDMRRELGRALREQVIIFEGMLTEFANAIASRCQIPQRDVLHVLRNEFRAGRERAAARSRSDAESKPALVDDDVAPADQIEMADA